MYVTQTMKKLQVYSTIEREHSHSPPTLTGAGHQRMVSTSTGCNQCLSVAKTTPKSGPIL